MKKKEIFLEKGDGSVRRNSRGPASRNEPRESTRAFFRENRPRPRLADGHPRRREGAAGTGPDVSGRADLHALSLRGLAAPRDRGRRQPAAVPPEARPAARRLSQTAPPLLRRRRNVGPVGIRPRDLDLPLRRQEREEGSGRVPSLLLPHARAVPQRPVRRLLPRPAGLRDRGGTPRARPPPRVGSRARAPCRRLSRKLGEREGTNRPPLGTRGGRGLPAR